jgi:arylsulfatase A-like enzyme
VVTQQVGLIDVMPTLLQVLGIERPLDLQGRSLLPLIRGEALPDRPLFAEAPSFGGLRAMRTERWKYIVSPATAVLFDLQTDPRETVNVCASDPSACVPFAREMATWQDNNRAAAARLGSTPAVPAHIDEELRRKLRALGYEEP